MPPEKQPASKSTTTKPLTPALSSKFRSVKSPLTPRVAGSPSLSPVLTATKQAFVKAKSPTEPEQTTTPLGGNITPRSAARKSRVGTESPLTPAQPRVPPAGQRSRASSGNEGKKQGASAGRALGITSPRLAMSTPTSVKATAPASGPVVTVHRRVSAAKSAVEGNKGTSKFFHASEVKSAIGSPGLGDTQRLPPKQGQFFVGPPPPPPPAGDNVNGKPGLDEKFFRANDIPQSAQPKGSLPPRIPMDRLNPSNTTSPAHDYRNTPPQSPKKIYNPPFPEPASPRKLYAAKPTSPAAARTTAERPNSTSSGISPVQPNAQGHRKSLSAGSLISLSARRLSASRPQVPLLLDLGGPTLSPRTAESNLLSPEVLSPRSISLASSNTIPTTVTSDTELSEAAIPSTTVPGEQKIERPSSSGHPQADEATTARRERKVLDLEISNSSLLAINKTLERELRKQTTELRRYRRLSRSGRLSLAPTARTVSEQSTFSLGTVTELDDEDQYLSGIDSDSEQDDEEESSIFSADSGSQSLTSPSAQSRQRTRDEKRLMHDLSRHHQLLLDSQRVNQSIRRCLTCTDELIKEGNKALDYRVGIGDIKLGGRVLNDDELGERGFAAGDQEPESRQGLLSPSVAKANLDHAVLWANTLHPLPPVQTDKETEQAKESTGISSLDELTDLLESVTADFEKTKT